MAGPEEVLLVGLVGLGLFMALALAGVTERLLPPLSHVLPQRHEDEVVVFSSVITLGTLVWPWVFWQLLGGALIRQCPWILVGLCWPVALGIFQMYDFYYDRCEDGSDHQHHRVQLIGGIHLDTSTIISMAFACATFFWAIGNLGQKQNLLPSSRLIMVALLICIGLIVPTQHFVDNNQRYALYVRVIQRVMVNWAMGLLLTALMIILSQCLPASSTAS